MPETSGQFFDVMDGKVGINLRTYMLRNIYVMVSICYLTYVR
jgi:hypothetical protein